MRKDTHDNDDDKLSFITLSAATKNVTRYLERTKDEQENGNRETDRSRTDEDREKDHRAYVERRLVDIAAFEDRARGKKKRI